MKILALNFNQKGVGTYRRSFYFSRELARVGHDVTLVTVSRRSKFGRKVSFKRDWIGELSEPRGTGPWIRLIEGPAWGYRLLPGWGSGPLDIWARVRELEAGDYDAVFGFEYHPNVSWPVYLTQRRKRYALFSDWCDWFGGCSNHFRGWKIAHRLDSYLEEKIRYRAKRLSVTSKVLFDRALSIGIPANIVVHIPEGAATDYIMPSNRYDARRTLCLPSDTPIVLAVRNGDMCREVRIFREVLRHVPEALLVVLGSSSIPAAGLAERLGISDRIRWTGWVSDEYYPVYLACADVCFCPLEDNLSDRARWPAKILDFLAAGRCTVTNAVGEVDRSFRDRDVAVLVGHEDEEFALAVAALIGESERRSYMGERARQMMESEWDWRLRGPQIAAMVGGA
jgi:glycosyltransferase involved in cell wall biosynthesis